MSSTKPGAALADELGRSARYAHLDVTKPDDSAAAVDVARREFGGLDVLVSNAGITAPPKPITDTPLDEYLRIGTVNQVGTFLGVQAVTRRSSTATADRLW
jgi:3alpha(or 20beta)-hydroxysteroid dehydrogenase